MSQKISGILFSLACHAGILAVLSSSHVKSSGSISFQWSWSVKLDSNHCSWCSASLTAMYHHIRGPLDPAQRGRYILVIHTTCLTGAPLQAWEETFLFSASEQIDVNYSALPLSLLHFMLARFLLDLCHCSEFMHDRSLSRVWLFAVP